MLDSRVDGLGRRILSEAKDVTAPDAGQLTGPRDVQEAQGTRAPNDTGVGGLAGAAPRCGDAVGVQTHLQAREIGTAVYYPRPLHELEPCRPFAKTGSWPHSEAASRETLALPFFPEMTEARLDAVAAALADVAPPRRR